MSTWTDPVARKIHPIAEQTATVSHPHFPRILRAMTLPNIATVITRQIIVRKGIANVSASGISDKNC